MKKLLQINITSNIGSTGRIVENLGLLAQKNGWESYIGCFESNESSSQIIGIGGKIDFFNHVLQTRFFDNHGFASVNSTKKFITEIEKINPDVIHLHNLHGYYLNISLLFEYLKKSNKRVFWTLYDCWSFTGHCSYFDLVKCDKWKKECNNCPNKKEYPKSIFLDKSRENFIKKKQLFNGVKNLTIIVNSNWLKSKVKNSYLSNYKIEMIPNGINLNDFKPVIKSDKKNELNLRGKFIILGIASQWNERKGLSEFIKISQRLNEDERIVLDGLNDKQRRNLPNTIIALDRAKSIKELVILYSMADVFVNATKEDNFPTTNLEALACGTPVVTYNTGGSPESVGSKTGYVVEKEDIESLMIKIREVKKRGAKTFFNDCVKKANLEFNHIDNYQKIINLF